MPTLSNKQRKNIARKNKENTEKQNKGATVDSIEKKAEKKKARNAKKKANRQAKYEKESQAELEAKIREYKEKREREYEIKAIKKAFLNVLQTEIWEKKKSQISTFRNGAVIIRFYREKYFSGNRKEYCFVFEVEAKDGFMLDSSVYKNYIFRKILSTSLGFKSEELEYIFNRAQVEFVKDSLLDVFKKFDNMKVIICFSLRDFIYNKLVGEFTSEHSNEVSSVQAQLLICRLKEFFKSQNLNITNVAENTSGIGIERNTGYYNDIAKRFENSQDSYLNDNNYSDEEEEEEEEDKKKDFNFIIQYLRGCSQCDVKNIYTLTFDVGYEYKSGIYSIVYRGVHYTIFNIDELFKTLLEDGSIYKNPICQMCCKKNEMKKELDMITSTLCNSGLDFSVIKRKVKTPINLCSANFKGKKEVCFVVALSENNGNNNVVDDNFEYEYKNTVDIVKTNDFQNATYKAIVPLCRRFMFWRPYADVTNSFRRMRIAFIIVCQKYLPVKLPDDICTHIFTFMIIPNMKSGIYGYKEVKLDFTKPEKIASFVKNVNFLTFR